MAALTHYCFFHSTTKNESSNEENTIPRMSITAMRKNPYYSIYYICLCRLIVLGVIPFSLLAFYNCAIYKRLSQPSKMIEENFPTRIRRNQENDLAKVLFAIVALCVVCHTLRFFLNFYEMIWINNILSCMQAGERDFPAWSHIVQEFSRLLLVLNSSVNIVIYCCFNAKFRKQVLRYKGTISKRLTTRTHITNEIEEQYHEEQYHSVELQPIKDKS